MGIVKRQAIVEGQLAKFLRGIDQSSRNVELMQVIDSAGTARHAEVHEQLITYPFQTHFVDRHVEHFLSIVGLDVTLR